MKKFKIAVLGLSLIFAFLLFNQKATAQGQYDVVVIGAGSGGVSAAIQAARMGARVALLEETDWIGGQMTAAAVSTMDEGLFLKSGDRRFGIYREFVSRIKSYYEARGKSVGTCYWSDQSICFEPSVGRRILEQMLQAEDKIDLYLRTKVTSVSASGDTVTGVVAQRKGGALSLQSKILIDATEYADVLPKTNVRYRVGNSTSDSINPSACIQDITYVAVMKKYPDGLPAGLRIDNPPGGIEEYEKNVSGFRQIVTKDGSGQFDANGQIVYPVNVAFHNAYRGLPDSSNPKDYTAYQPGEITKTGINWANDYKATVTYLEGLAARKKINCEAKLKTLQFIYYFQNELGQTDWSIANDEGFDTSFNIEENLCDNISQEFKEIEKYFSLTPYVRESQRLVGVKTLTASDIKRVGEPPKAARSFSSSVAIGSYPVDLHGCKDEEDLETWLEKNDDVPEGFVEGPFQVPFEVFIPETVDGLLVAEKNLSITRLANGALRLQPITMLTGQAAGAIAAVSVRESVEPRRLNPVVVQEELVKAGSALSLYSFSDVPQSNPYWSYIQLASLYGIMIGYPDETFGVNDPLLRRHAAIVIVKAFDIPINNIPSTPSFIDVPTSDPQYNYIEAIFRDGIVSGCSKDPPKFCPDSHLSRAGLAVMLVRALKLNLSEAPTEQIFEDVPSSHWAFPYVQLAAEKGIFFGCSQTPRRFCPDKIASRGETALAVMKAFIIRQRKTQEPPPILGDVNGDGKVDILDYNILVGNFGGGDCGNVADIDGDCDVDIFDYNFLVTNFGKTTN